MELPHNVQVVDLSGGPGSENTCAVGGNAEPVPKFPPGLLSQLLEDTIIMVPVVQMQDSARLATGLLNEAPLNVPSSVRGKLQARLGDLSDGVRASLGSRTRAGIRERCWSRAQRRQRGLGR
ncbi:hypothetical protein PIB30_100445 [Stylosanthes scabra]|uniref:Uncharacterized protein n=1 Tax=Stylosanthes scabra TaxID=79078 RepID=A0ABU6RXL7_9FABA|nr:hypothetical protein [Stylosanthes scabra]